MASKPSSFLQTSDATRSKLDNLFSSLTGKASPFVKKCKSSSSATNESSALDKSTAHVPFNSLVFDQHKLSKNVPQSVQQPVTGSKVQHSSLVKGGKTQQPNNSLPKQSTTRIPSSSPLLSRGGMLERKINVKSPTKIDKAKPQIDSVSPKGKSPTVSTQDSKAPPTPKPPDKSAKITNQDSKAPPTPKPPDKSAIITNQKTLKQRPKAGDTTKTINKKANNSVKTVNTKTDDTTKTVPTKAENFAATVKTKMPPTQRRTRHDSNKTHIPESVSQQINTPPKLKQQSTVVQQSSTSTKLDEICKPAQTVASRRTRQNSNKQTSPVGQCSTEGVKQPESTVCRTISESKDRGATQITNVPDSPPNIQDIKSQTSAVKFRKSRTKSQSNDCDDVEETRVSPSDRAAKTTFATQNASVLKETRATSKGGFVKESLNSPRSGGLIKEKLTSPRDGVQVEWSKHGVRVKRLREVDRIPKFKKKRKLINAVTSQSSPRVSSASESASSSGNSKPDIGPKSKITKQVDNLKDSSKQTDPESVKINKALSDRSTNSPNQQDNHKLNTSSSKATLDKSTCEPCIDRIDASIHKEYTLQRLTKVCDTGDDSSVMTRRSTSPRHGVVKKHTPRDGVVKEPLASPTRYSDIIDCGSDVKPCSVSLTRLTNTPHIPSSSVRVMFVEHETLNTVHKLIDTLASTIHGARAPTRRHSTDITSSSPRRRLLRSASDPQKDLTNPTVPCSSESFNEKFVLTSPVTTTSTNVSCDKSSGNHVIITTNVTKPQHTTHTVAPPVKETIASPRDGTLKETIAAPADDLVKDIISTGKSSSKSSGSGLQVFQGYIPKVSVSSQSTTTNTITSSVTTSVNSVTSCVTTHCVTNASSVIKNRVSGDTNCKSSTKNTLGKKTSTIRKRFQMGGIIAYDSRHKFTKTDKLFGVEDIYDDHKTQDSESHSSTNDDEKPRRKRKAKRSSDPKTNKKQKLSTASPATGNKSKQSTATSGGNKSKQSTATSSGANETNRSTATSIGAYKSKQSTATSSGGNKCKSNRRVSQANETKAKSSVSDWVVRTKRVYSEPTQQVQEGQGDSDSQDNLLGESVVHDLSQSEQIENVEIDLENVESQSAEHSITHTGTVVDTSIRNNIAAPPVNKGQSSISPQTDVETETRTNSLSHVITVQADVHANDNGQKAVVKPITPSVRRNTRSSTHQGRVSEGTCSEIFVIQDKTDKSKQQSENRKSRLSMSRGKIRGKQSTDTLARSVDQQGNVSTTGVDTAMPAKVHASDRDNKAKGDVSSLSETVVTVNNDTLGQGHDAASVEGHLAHPEVHDSAASRVSHDIALSISLTVTTDNSSPPRADTLSPGNQTSPSDIFDEYDDPIPHNAPINPNDVTNQNADQSINKAPIDLIDPDLVKSEPDDLTPMQKQRRKQRRRVSGRRHHVIVSGSESESGDDVLRVETEDDTQPVARRLIVKLPRLSSPRLSVASSTSPPDDHHTHHVDAIINTPSRPTRSQKITRPSLRSASNRLRSRLNRIRKRSSRPRAVVRRTERRRNKRRNESKELRREEIEDGETPQDYRCPQCEDAVVGRWKHEMRRHMVIYHHIIWDCSKNEGSPGDPNTLFNMYHLMKCLNCDKMYEKKESFRYHNKICGTADVECEMCSRHVKPHRLAFHMQHMHLIDQHNTHKHQGPTGRGVLRDAAKRAMQHMQQTDGKPAAPSPQKMYERFTAPPPGYELVRKWKRRLQKSFVKCSECKLSFGSVEGLTKDYYQHLGAGARGFGYKCIQCDYTATLEKDMMRHTKQHSQDEESSTDESDNSVADPDVNFSDHYTTDDDIDATLKPTRDDYAKYDGPKTIPYGIGEGFNNFRAEGTAVYDAAFDWTYANYRERDDEPLCFLDSRPRKSDWMRLPEHECMGYLPLRRMSPPIYVTDASNKCKVPRDDIFRIPSLESVTHGKDSAILNAGGPVWACEFCPLPVNQSVTSPQYLAVYAHRDPDVVHSVNTSHLGCALLQIWDCGIMDKTTMRGTPRLAYTLAMDSGAVWNVKWCSAGVWEHPDTKVPKGMLARLGMIALACSDGSIRIYSLPHPESLQSPSSHTPMYKPRPTITLGHHGNTSMCLNLDWCQNTVIGAYGDGLVSLWDLSHQGTLSRAGNAKFGFIQYPYDTFHAHQGPVTCVVFQPIMGKFFATCGHDRAIKYWDIDNTEKPVHGLVRGHMTDLKWGGMWPHLFMAADDCYHFQQNCSQVCDSGYFTGSTRPLIPHPSTIRALAHSDWLNAIATGDFHGSLFAAYLPSVMLSFKWHKTIATRRVPIYRTSVVTLDSLNGHATPSKSKSGRNKQKTSDQSSSGDLFSTVDEYMEGLNPEPSDTRVQLGQLMDTACVVYHDYNMDNSPKKCKSRNVTDASHIDDCPLNAVLRVNTLYINVRVVT